MSEEKENKSESSSSGDGFENRHGDDGTISAYSDSSFQESENDTEE